MNRYFSIMLFLFSQMLPAQETFVLSRFLSADYRGIYVDSLILDNEAMQNTTVAFSFTIKSEAVKPTFDSYIETSAGIRPMNPACETNLEKFDFVSKLEILRTEEIYRAKIVIQSHSESAFPIEVTYHIFPLNPITDITREKSSPNRFACPCPAPDYVPRSSWGSAFQLTNDIYRPPATLTDVTHLIVHHSATSNQSTNWPSVVAAIFNYHANTNQWQDIGYNWLIDPEGNLYQGRGGGEDVRGAHMCGYNNNTLGVCLLGTFTNADPTPAALQTLETLFAYKACRKNFDPSGSADIVSFSGHMQRISGHKDGCAVNYTECPGNKLYAFLPVIRENCIARIQDSCSLVSVGDNVSNFHAPEIFWDSSGRLNVNSQQDCSGIIYNLEGKIIHKLDVEPGLNQYTFLLPSGMYIISVMNEKFSVTNKYVVP